MTKGKTLPVPHDLDAERAVLGSVISRPDGMVDAALLLRPDDFFDGRNAAIFAALLDLWQRGDGLDVVSLRIELDRRGRLGAAGGMEYVSGLWGDGMSVEMTAGYSRRVRETAAKRRLITVGGMIAALGYEQTGDDPESGTTLESLLGRAESMLLNITGQVSSDDVVTMSQAIREYTERLETRMLSGNPRPGYSTGIPALDSLTGGIEPGDLWVVSGPTGGGKSTVLLQMALAAALETPTPRQVMILSLEMSRDQVVQRALSSLARVDGTVLRSGLLRDDELGRVNNAVPVLDESPIWISARGGLSLRDITHRMRKRKTRGGLDIGIVDYLGLIRPNGTAGNKAQEQEEIAYGLKTLAGELGLGMIAAAQLSRDGIKNVPPSQWLHYHKNSSGIEQAADLCMSVALPDEDGEPDADGLIPVELWITKQRNGPTDMIELKWHKPTNRLISPSEDDPDAFASLVATGGWS